MPLDTLSKKKEKSKGALHLISPSVQLMNSDIATITVRSARSHAECIQKRRFVTALGGAGTVDMEQFTLFMHLQCKTVCVMTRVTV